MGEGLTLDDPVFSTFAFWAAIMTLKMMIMSLLTARQRFSKKVFSNKEDTPLEPQSKVVFDDDDVERVRRCHRNDLENVLPFLILGPLYCLSHPAATTAKIVFRVFSGARLLHTIVYLGAVPQPSRALCFMVNMLCNIFMVVNIILATW